MGSGQTAFQAVCHLRRFLPITQPSATTSIRSSGFAITYPGPPPALFQVSRNCSARSSLSPPRTNAALNGKKGRFLGVGSCFQPAPLILGSSRAPRSNRHSTNTLLNCLMLLSRLLELPDSAEVRPNSLGLIRATHLLARNMRLRRSRQDEKKFAQSIQVIIKLHTCSPITGERRWTWSPTHRSPRAICASPRWRTTSSSSRT